MNRKTFAALAATLLTATYAILPAFAFSDLAKINRIMPGTNLQDKLQDSAESAQLPMGSAIASSLAEQSALSSTVQYAANGVPAVLASVQLSAAELTGLAEAGSGLSRGSLSLNDITSTEAPKPANTTAESVPAETAAQEIEANDDGAGSTAAPDTAGERPVFGSEIQRLAWFGNVENIYAKGDVATVTDLATGLKMQIMRTGGTNHADCETIDSTETDTLLKVAGGEWNWTRRPVIVEIDGYTIAASLTARPHAGRDDQPAHETVSNRSGGYGRGINWDSVKGNSMDGHFDIHFYGSRTHCTNRQDSAHQAAIQTAYKWDK